MLNVTSLSGGYYKNIVVNEVSLRANAGDMIYVLGANCCGKTTLLNMVIGYKKRKSGSVEFDGESIDELSVKQMAKFVSYIPQQHVPAYNYAVRDVVVMGRAGSLPIYAAPKDKDFALVGESLDMLGIARFIDAQYSELSGGERQLVLIARALCQQAKIIVMDEPLQSLDFVNQAMVLRACKLLIKKGYSVIMSTHTAISNYADTDKVLLMSKNGSAIFGDIERILTQEYIERAYGAPLQAIYNTDELGGKHIICMPTNV
jgi:iron complex transport system ATP-binding protein